MLPQPGVELFKTNLPILYNLALSHYLCCGVFAPYHPPFPADLSPLPHLASGTPPYWTPVWIGPYAILGCQASTVIASRPLVC
jgi:hypothetical protein